MHARVAQVEAGDLPGRQPAVPRRLARPHPADHLHLTRAAPAEPTGSMLAPCSRLGHPAAVDDHVGAAGGRAEGPQHLVAGLALERAVAHVDRAAGVLAGDRSPGSTRRRVEPGGGQHRRQRHRRGAVVGVEPLVALLLRPRSGGTATSRGGSTSTATTAARRRAPSQRGVTSRLSTWPRYATYIGSPMTDLPAPRLLDRFGRAGRDLRVSVTDRCNLRCTYCMPAEGLRLAAQARDAHRRRDRAAGQRHGRRSASPRSGSPAASRCCAAAWSTSCAGSPRSSPGRGSR